uniref:DMT family transporter n=1 Tax=Thaumasiovibrio occultus TaxID=1891184 RepID=UPI000B358A37|nr:DMT family transporter [Thaumasiovibrio occultus]
MSSSISSHLPVGVRFMLLSALGFALMSACVKYVSQHGIPVFEIVAARAFVSLVISFLDVKRKGISVWGHNRKLLLARGTVGTLGLICVYYALTVIPLAEATVLQYVHPVFTALLAVFFLKERVQPWTTVCILLCLLGVFAMVFPSLSATRVSTLSLPAVGIALLGAFGSSIAYVIVRKLSQTEDSSVIIFYFPLVALPVSLLLMGDSFVMPDLNVLGMLILVGIFTQIGQYGLTMAMKTQTAGTASAYSYVQIVFSLVLGIIFFNELPPVWSVAGGMLIITGALINLFGPKLMRRFASTTS